ncbi:MAG: hypothetical protein AAGF04_02175 [Chlamydiota bacterium]
MAVLIPEVYCGKSMHESLIQGFRGAMLHTPTFAKIAQMVAQMVGDVTTWSYLLEDAKAPSKWLIDKCSYPMKGLFVLGFSMSVVSFYERACDIEHLLSNTDDGKAYLKFCDSGVQLLKNVLTLSMAGVSDAALVPLVLALDVGHHLMDFNITLYDFQDIDRHENRCANAKHLKMKPDPKQVAFEKARICYLAAVKIFLGLLGVLFKASAMYLGYSLPAIIFTCSIVANLSGIAKVVFGKVGIDSSFQKHVGSIIYNPDKLCEVVSWEVLKDAQEKKGVPVT